LIVFSHLGPCISKSAVYVEVLSFYSIELTDLRRKISGNTVLGQELTLKFTEF